MRRLLTASILAASSGLFMPSAAIAREEGAVAAVAQAPDIKIKSTGAEPRRELRYAFEAGSEQKIVMTMRMSMTQTMNGNAMPAMSVPAITVPVTGRILSVDQGDATYEMVLGAVQVADDGSQMGAFMKTAMKALEGMKITGTVDERGYQTNITVDAGGNTNPMLAGQVDSIRNSLTQMTPPLPAEPLGNGASWSYEQAAASGGVTATNNTTITLTRVDGKALALTMDLDIGAEPQAINSPSLPPTAKANLESMAGKGTGEATVLLNQLFPVAMNGSTDVKIDMAMDMNGTPMKMGQAVTMNIAVEEAAK